MPCYIIVILFLYIIQISKCEFILDFLAARVQSRLYRLDRYRKKPENGPNVSRLSWHPNVICYSYIIQNLSRFIHLILFIISYTDGSSLYRAFLLREFSNENLEFWLAVEYYRNTKPKKMAAKAQQIYKEFIAVQAPKQVRTYAILIKFLINELTG